MQNINPNSGNSLNWSAYHASKKPGRKLEKTGIDVLPMFSYPANTVAMMIHSMDVIREVTEHLNQGQITVVGADQPLYAIMKQIQCVLPEEYGQRKFFIMLGGLHIEMTALKTLGQWLVGSG